MRIRLPTAAPEVTDCASTFSVGQSIAGLRIGIRTDRAWRSWVHIGHAWADRLEADGAAVMTVETGAMVGDAGAHDRKRIDDLAPQVDAAIVGLGTCGSCTSFTIADAVAIEEHHKPVIAVVTDEFATHGHNMARHLGHADLRILVLPYPLEARPEAELSAIADDFYPRALDLLGIER